MMTAPIQFTCVDCGGRGYVEVKDCMGMEAYGKAERKYSSHRCTDRCVRKEVCMGCLGTGVPR